jgi:signal transduction histidine kinase/DNA-binding NarL/FixJ family response regulator
LAETREDVKAGDELDKLLRTDIKGRYRFVVVDNSESERNDICSALRTAGQLVECAADLASANKLIQQFATNGAGGALVVILDKEMPGGHGDEAIPSLRTAYPAAHFILMSHELSAEKIEQWRRNGVPATPKPLTRSFLIAALRQFEDGVGIDAAADYGAHNKQPPSKPTLALPATNFDLEAKTTHWLARLRQQTHANGVAIFGLTQTGAEGGRVALFAHDVLPSFDLRRDQVADTIFSPVQDVARGKETYICEDAYATGKHLGYLHEMGRFDACIGVPVPAATNMQYALFVFWDAALKQDAAERNAMLERTYVAADVIGGLIEQRQLLNVIADKHSAVVEGETAAAFTHDIYHHIGTLNSTPAKLREELDNLKANLQQAPETLFDHMTFMRQNIDDLQAAAAKLQQIGDLFRKLRTKGEAQYSRIDTIIKQAVQLAQRDAESKYKKISVGHDDTGIVFAKADERRLMQILQNLILNGVQQLALMNKPDEGHVVVSATVATTLMKGEKTDVVQIRVEDNGPGIHAAEQESIFNLGVTHREGGSGIGLYISRILVHQLGGRVQVESSALGWGSCFLIEIPCIY